MASRIKGKQNKDIEMGRDDDGQDCRHELCEESKSVALPSLEIVRKRSDAARGKRERERMNGRGKKNDMAWGEEIRYGID